MQSHTSSVHTLSNSTAHSATHFTSDICRKPGTSRLNTLFLIYSEPSAKSGGLFSEQGRREVKFKSCCNGGNFSCTLVSLPEFFFRQSQPSCQPQAWHYHRTTMLHIKQPLTEIKESAHDQNTPRQPPAEGNIQRPSASAHRRGQKHHWHSQADQGFSMQAGKFVK